MNPGGEHFMEDLDVAGGVAGVLAQLKSQILDSPTVSGPGIAEIAASVASVDESVIHPMSDPVRPEGGIAILKGSLAPDGAVVKQ